MGSDAEETVKSYLGIYSIFLSCTAIEGLALGLFFAKEIVEKLGGTLGVESKVGKRKVIFKFTVNR